MASPLLVNFFNKIVTVAPSMNSRPANLTIHDRVKILGFLQEADHTPDFCVVNNTILHRDSHFNPFIDLREESRTGSDWDRLAKRGLVGADKRLEYPQSGRSIRRGLLNFVDEVQGRVICL